MREAFCSIASALVLKIVFVFFIFQFGIMGATLGAIAGLVIGWGNNMRLKEGFIIGAISGTSLSYKLLNAVSDYLHSDDADELVFFLHMVKLIGKDIVKIIHGDEHKLMGFNKLQVPDGKAYSLVRRCLIWTVLSNGDGHQ